MFLNPNDSSIDIKTHVIRFIMALSCGGLLAEQPRGHVDVVAELDYQDIQEDSEGYFALIRELDGQYIVLSASKNGITGKTSLTEKPFSVNRRNESIEKPEQLFTLNPTGNQKVQLCNVASGEAIQMNDSKFRIRLPILPKNPSFESVSTLSERSSAPIQQFTMKKRRTGEYQFCMESGGKESDCGHWTVLRLEKLKGPLFAQGRGDAHSVDPNDIEQNQIGDCFLLASIAAVAKHHPEQIVEMIKGDEVHFGDGTKVKWDRSVPAIYRPDSFGSKPFGVQTGDDEEIWPVVLEQAAQAKAKGISNIHGGLPAEAIEMLTGKQADQVWLHPLVPHHWLIKEQELFDRMGCAYSEGRAVVCSSRLKEDRVEKGVVAGHAYALVGIDPKNQRVRLQNPHGTGHLDLSIAELKGSFLNIAIESDKDLNRTARRFIDGVVRINDALTDRPVDIPSVTMKKIQEGFDPDSRYTDPSTFDPNQPLFKFDFFKHIQPETR